MSSTDLPRSLVAARPGTGARLRPGRGARGALPALALAALTAAGCWRTGEPTPSEALVTWAAYPESVRVGETFLLEFGGPISPTACGRLDTATLAIGDTAIELAAVRSTFEAVCANQRISFYEARPVQIGAAGRYAVLGTGGRRLGSIVATDPGPFSGVIARGEGTLRDVGSCLLFGPGWIGGQRVFALSGASAALREAAGRRRIVYVEGRLRGFSSCGAWGSRPRIRVDTAWVTGRAADDWY